MHEQIFPGITQRNKKHENSSSNYRYTDEYPKGRDGREDHNSPGRNSFGA